MTLREIAQPRWLLSSLLIAGAALFAIGVAAERNAADKHTESGVETVNTGVSGAETTTLAAESGGDEAAHTDETGGEGTAPTEVPAVEVAGHSESSSETVLGVNLESTGLVIVAAIVSLALAVLTWRLNVRLLLLTTVAFGAVFTAFDIAELVHQIKESRAGIAALAGLIALLHAAAALVAEQRTTSASA